MTTNVARATILQFFDEYDAADNIVADAIGNRKDVRTRARGEGLIMPAFDRMRKLSRQSGDQRQEQDRALRYYMTTIGKPLDIPANEDEPQPEPAYETAINEHQRRKVHNDGFQAGRAGRSRDDNTWSPGSLLYQIFDQGWRDGAEALAQSQVQEEAPPKKRGRPPGAVNKSPSTRRRRTSGNGDAATLV